jgi:hypothetical protein
MKLQLVSAFLALVSAVFAAGENRGSFASVTSTLTLTNSTIAAPTVLPNGNKQTISTWNTYKVTNAAILAECQRQGLLTSGTVEGWRIYAIFDSDELSGFAISNGLQTLWIDSVIRVSRGGQTGFAAKGKWVNDTQDRKVSGSTTYLDGFVLTVSIGGVDYLATCAPLITDKVVTFGVLADPVWRPNAFVISPVGISDTEEGSGAILRGSLSIAAARSNWDLKLSLLGFPGFDS